MRQRFVSHPGSSNRGRTYPQFSAAVLGKLDRGDEVTTRVPPELLPVVLNELLGLRLPLNEIAVLLMTSSRPRQIHVVGAHVKVRVVDDVDLGVVHRIL